MNLLTFFKHKSTTRICSVAPNVLLKVCVLMVVDTHTLVSRELSQIEDQASLAHRCLTLQQNWVLASHQRENMKSNYAKLVRESLLVRSNPERFFLVAFKDHNN